MLPQNIPTIRHALITGGSRGVGLNIAQLFAKTSYRCTLISRSPTSLASALTTLESSHLSSSLQHTSISGDISSRTFWSSSGFGSQYDGSRIDVLVNCAGVTQSSLLVRTDPEKVREVVDTNLTGMILGTRFLLRKKYISGSMKEDVSPVVINVASLLGLKGGIGAVAYAASKAGVIGFTRALSEELGKSCIRVNALVPGYVATDMTAELIESETLMSKIPAGRFGRPDEIADAALFLAKNQYANNCVLNIDGGLSAT